MKSGKWAKTVLIAGSGGVVGNLTEVGKTSTKHFGGLRRLYHRV